MNNSQNEKKPRYYNLMRYVCNHLYDLLRNGPGASEFMEQQKIVNFNVEMPGKIWAYGMKIDYFVIALKFSSEVGFMDEPPLSEYAVAWLEQLLGAYLWVDRIDPRREGGGYVYYRLCMSPRSEKGAVDLYPDIDETPAWIGGHWRE
ncbi:MAG: hypothetical protein IKQ17_13440 [Kiritimatiellae bacterium]|nr:hypothetical protein [Kiritimatiellia bacterium]